LGLLLPRFPAFSVRCTLWSCHEIEIGKFLKELKAQDSIQ